MLITKSSCEDKVCGLAAGIAVFTLAAFLLMVPILCRRGPWCRVGYAL